LLPEGDATIKFTDYSSNLHFKQAPPQRMTVTGANPYEEIKKSIAFRYPNEMRR